MYMKKSASIKGFTLIELMIALTIGGILLAIGVPSFKYTILTNRVKTAASDFHTSIMLARSEAIKLNRDVDITGTTNGWDITYTKEDSSTATIRSYQDVSPDVSILCDVDADNSAEACPASITINHNGRLKTPPFSLWFYTAVNNNVRMRCVNIELSGMPRVVIDTDSSSTNGCG